MGFEIKDSGERQEFEGGMVRDTETGKIDFTNLLLWFEPMGTRYAEHLTKGRGKYRDVGEGLEQVPNWTLASGWEEYHRYRRSAVRHMKQWLAGEEDEDHAAAVLFNINGAEYVKARMLNEDES